jgi:small subunit ribosomal protein S1
MLNFAAPKIKTIGYYNMFQKLIFKQLNADAQESAGAGQTEEATTATTTVPEQTIEAEKQETFAPTAHDDFDWSVDKRNIITYTPDEKKKYHSVYDNTFVQLNEGELIKGMVVGITKTDVVLNIGFKSDGLISLNEFRDNPSLKVGDDVEVMVVEKEDG